MVGEKNEVSKKGLTNIFNTGKQLSRTEAARKYQALSPEAREEADGWINRAFYLATDFPTGQKINPKNPEHSKYVEEWLKQRDTVMEWNREWKQKDNLDTRIMRENIPPTPIERVRLNEGIFEQRMDGKEFKKYVIERISEASIYNSKIGRRQNERPIAIAITSKLLENSTWLKNATSSREGRDTMRILQSAFGRNPEERADLTKQERDTYDRLNKIIDPHIQEVLTEERNNRERNLEEFVKSFPQLSEQIKKTLEAQGIQVEKIYYRTFTTNKIEIRADTSKKVETNHDTYGYRGDPHVSNIRTEKKNISVGGIDIVSGVFQDSSYFTKLGTAETDWDAQLAIGELAVLAGVGIRAVVSGARSILLRASERTTVEIGEKLVGRSVRDTVQDLGDTLPGIARTRVKIGDDSVESLADTLRMSTDAGARPTITLAPGPYSPELIRGVDAQLVNEVGRDLSIRVMSYGYHPNDLKSLVTRMQTSGASRSEIQTSIEKQMQLADTFLDEAIFKPKIEEAKIALGDNALNSGLRNTLLKEAYKDANTALRAHDGNITDAIATARFTDKLKEWHKINDFADGVVNVPGESIMRRIANEANDYAKKLETRIMGTSSASGFIVHKQTREEKKDSNRERETQALRKTSEQKDSQALPKIKEKKNTPRRKI